MIEDEKYPYVYAEYFIESIGPRRMSPGEARAIIEGIADAIYMDRDEMAIHLADLQLIKMKEFRNTIDALLRKDISHA